MVSQHKRGTCSNFLGNKYVYETLFGPLVAPRAAENPGKSAESQRRVWGETAVLHWRRFGFYLGSFSFTLGDPSSSRKMFRKIFTGSFGPGFRTTWKSFAPLPGSLCYVFGVSFSFWLEMNPFEREGLAGGHACMSLQHMGSLSGLPVFEDWSQKPYW